MKGVRRFNGILLGIALVIILAACSAEPTPVATPPSATEVADTPPPEVTEEVEPQTAEPERVELLLDVPGLQEIALTTPEDGVGPKPQFAWQPLDGATRYVLVVYTAEREPYWAWEGAETTVYLGGGDSAPAPDSAGPVLITDMAWAVMAMDADNRLIGSSVLQPIAP